MSLAPEIFMQSKKKAVANSKAMVKDFPANSAQMYEGIATFRVMVVHSRDLGKLRAYF